MRSTILLFLLLLNVSCQHEIVYVTETVTHTHTIRPKVLAPKTTSTIDIVSTFQPLPTNVPRTNTSHPLVQFELDCKIDPTFCNKVSKAVAAALDEFTRVVYIKNSLLIYVKYYKFCDIECANDTFGWGTPTSQFTLPFEDGADLNYVYPQALAKQLAPYSGTSVWAQYDLEVEINHDLYMNTSGTPKYWFTSDGDIQPHQIDLRYIVLHQLLHGLGFVSSWAAYFWTDASPFRKLLDGLMDPIELQLVTPGPYWFVNQEGGPVYITGFQPTMIFDKFLMTRITEMNQTSSFSLSDLAFDMQDFCVQNQDAFIVNFIRLLNKENQSTTAHQLWMSMSKQETLTFRFQPATVANSSFNLIPYLNQTYQGMALLTGQDMFSSANFEYMDPTLNRPGLMISHLDNQYMNTIDFLMTKEYHTGQTLEQLTDRFYRAVPELQYKEHEVYRSPIGPGILRILDSIGYSTVLTKTHYTTGVNVKKLKSPSICDDRNSNPEVNLEMASIASRTRLPRVSLIALSCLIYLFTYN